MTDIPLRTRSGGPDGGHLDNDTLADLQEDLLEPTAERAARGHLASCPVCAARSDRLAELPALLASAAPVGPVPAEVVAGVDAALSAEVAAGDGSGTRTVVPLDAGRRSALGMRVLQAAAVLVLVLAGVGIALGPLSGGSDDNGSSAGSAGAGEAAGRASALGQFPLTASGRAWTGPTVTKAVPDLLAARLAPPVDARTLREGAAGDSSTSNEDGVESPAPVAGSTAQRLASGPALADCVAALVGGPVTPLAVDLARWDDDPAAVILLPTPDDASTVDAWVVAPDCGAADAKVLYFARVARP